jgi:hypothetical protein
MSLRAEIIHDAAALARLTVPWRALLDRAAAPSLCKTPTWLLAWWRQFGSIEGRKLCVVALHDASGELVALLPLCRRTVMVRRVLPVRRLELLATGEDQEDEICSDYTGAIVASGYEAEVAELTGKLLVEGRLGGVDQPGCRPRSRTKARARTCRCRAPSMPTARAWTAIAATW